MRIFQLIISILSLFLGGWIGLLLAMTSALMFLFHFNLKNETKDLQKKRKERRINNTAIVFSILGIILNTVFLILYYLGITDKIIGMF